MPIFFTDITPPGYYLHLATSNSLMYQISEGLSYELPCSVYYLKLASDSRTENFLVPRDTIDKLEVTMDSYSNECNSTPFKVLYDGVESESVDDLKKVILGYDNGKTIVISKVPIENRIGQAFYIGADKDKVILKYTSQQSLDNAIYSYLDLLGIHWYGPGENWLFKPKKLNVVMIKGEWKEPTFRNRSFFGTGGLDTNFPIYDSTNNYKKQWKAFERRNRYNVDFEQPSHVGMAFYQDNASILNVHPEWFNSESGKFNGRFKAEVPEALQLFKDWAASKIIKNSLFTTINVDPEDGRGGSDDPIPPDGFQGISDWNVADKWWWVANEVAKDYDENSSKVIIAMYAYGDGGFNALVPKFPLRKNVYPVIIPYAFQTSYLPNEMVTTWANTIEGKMGIYDYWNITQWSLGLPQFSMQSIKQKLVFWHNNKIDGINQETTAAAGPMGHIFWLTGQLEWDLSKNFESLYNQYLTDCFGGASSEMKKMYDRWSNNYQGAADVDFSLINLYNASKLVEVDSKEWLRINELKAYVHFIKLMNAHDGSKESMEKIFHWIYGINHLMVVQTAAFADQNYIAPFYQRPVPLSSKPLTTSQIEKQFKEDYSDIKVNYTISPFVFEFDKVSYTIPIANDAWKFGGYESVFFFIAPFTGSVSLEVGAQSNSSFTVSSDFKVLVKENAGKSNFTHTETINDHSWSMKEFLFAIEKGKKYYLRNSGGFSRIKIKTPGIVIFNNQGTIDFDNYAYPKKYFYVPLDATEIVYTDNGKGVNDALGAGLYNPEGIKVSKKSAGALDTWKVEVLPEHRGKIWYGSFGYPNWTLKNIPNLTSLQPFIYKQ